MFTDICPMTIEVKGHLRFVRTIKSLNDASLQRKIDTFLHSAKAGEIRGDYIKNRPYPTRYLKDGVSNLYRYPIFDYRLIYTIVTQKETKTYLILDFLTHKEHDVIFGYHTT